jgi:multidrug resistance protein, MATE family
VNRTLLPLVDRRNPVRELAAPRAVGQIGQLALIATDLVLLGRLGTTALSAAGLAVLLFNQLRTTGAGLVGTVGERVASAVTRAEARARAGVSAGVGLRTGGELHAGGGSGQDRAGTWRRSAEYEVRDLVRGAVAVATAAGAAGALIMIGCGRLIGLLSQDPRFAAPAQAMLIALAPGLLPYLWCQALRQYGLGMRRPAALAPVTLLSVGLNLGLSWVLGFGAGPVPGFGVAGIGAATGLVQLLSLGVLYLAMRHDPVLAPMLSLAGWRASWPAVRRLLRSGGRTHGRGGALGPAVVLLLGPEFA